MDCNGRFRVPCAVVGDGFVKGMSREALVMLLVDCFSVDHELGEEGHAPPPPLMQMLSGLEPAQIVAAQMEILSVMTRANRPTPEPGPDILSQLFERAVNIEEVSPEMRAAIDTLIEGIDKTMKEKSEELLNRREME